MAKSSAEIAAEIEQLKQQMADGIPYENSHAYRAARFDWLLNGKRDGLDAYQRTVDQAMQNKLQREATAAEGEANRQNALKMAKIGKESAEEENEITWRKDIALAANTLRQVKQQQAKGLADEFDVTAAEETYNSLVDRGIAKGYKNVPTASVKQEAPSTEPTGDNKSIRERYLGIINNPDGATDEDLEMAQQAAASLMDSDSVGKVKAIRAKRQKDAEKHADDELIKVIDDDLNRFYLTKASDAIKQIKDPERRKTYEDKLAKRRTAWNAKQRQKKSDATNPFLTK